MAEDRDSFSGLRGQGLKNALALFPGIQPETLYLKILLALPDSIAITDLQGNILYASPVTFTMFGGKEEDVVGKTIFEWIAAIDRDRAKENFLRIRNGMELPPNQYLLKKVDGTEFYGGINSAFLRDQEGKKVGLISVIRDISLQKKAEEEVLQNDARYRLLFETAHDSVFLMDENRFLECNSKALETFGCLKEEMLGKSLMDFSPELQPDGASSSLLIGKKVMEALEGISQRFEWKNKKIDGTLFDAEISLNAISIGGTRYLQAMVRNISKRKRTDDRLKKFSACLLSFTIDPVHNINLLTMLSGEILGPVCSLYCHGKDGQCQIYGKWNIPEEDMPMGFDAGRLCCNIMQMESKEIHVIENLTETDFYRSDPLLSRHRIKSYAGIRIWANGEPVGMLSTYFHTEYIPDNADSYFFSLIASAIGVEEVRKTEQDKMVRYATELRELNNTKDKFFSIIAHDLKGPFSAIMGFSDILTTEWSDYTEEERLNFVQNINSSAKNTFRLLENLLEWSMGQTGKMKFRPNRIDLSLLANDVVILLRDQAEKKQIKLYTAVNFNTFVNADENMARTIIRNLVSNAIKFTGKGGQVRISARTVQATTDFPDMVEVCIVDTGVGIEKELIPRLFQIEEPTKTSGTAQEKGTGLGLIICRDLVEKNSGKIYVESEPGKGSKFCFTIPASF